MNISQLEKQISSANLAYAQNLPILTDTEYDLLWQQLFKLDPENPLLYHTTNNPHYSNLAMHRYQIYGTQKAFNTEDLRPFFTRFGSDKLILEPKYDGCAAVFYKGQDIHHDKLILSGDGIKGQDVSRHLLAMYYFNRKAIISGELIISWSDWDKDFGANPRNVVSGWLQRDKLDKDLARKIQFIQHNYGDLNQIYVFSDSFDHLNETLLSCYHQWSKLYPLDGIMIKVFDEEKRLITGNNGAFYHWSIAWKPPMQTKKTIVTDIIWNTSRAGKVIPTVCYEPISLCGTTNSKATGNNAKWVLERDIKVGSEIVVGKAGEIIPKILDVSNVAQKHDLNAEKPGFNAGSRVTGTVIPCEFSPLLNTPKINCPTCNSPLTWEGVHLICTSDRCIAKLIQSISYFYSDKGMEVKSIGEFMLGDIIEQPEGYHILSNFPYALLEPETFGIDTLLFATWGEKKYNTYRENLSGLSKNPVHFIAALGYDKLAYKTALKLWYYVFEKSPLTSVAKTAQKNFIEAFLIYDKAKKELKNFTFLPVPPIPKITYCITGTLSITRNEMIDYLAKYKWSFSNQVSKHTDILIIGEDPGETKTRKAKELNILTINENEIGGRL